MTLEAAIVAIVAALVGAVVGGLLGFRGTHILEIRREKRQHEADKKSIAGALRAELGGIREWWDEIKARRKSYEMCKKSNPDEPDERKIPDELALSSLMCSAQESYFAVFDGAGPRLHLLPSELVKETVSCYVRMKAVMDGLRALSHIAEQARLIGPGQNTAFTRVATDMNRRIMECAEEAVAELQSLVGKLDAIAL